MIDKHDVRTMTHEKHTPLKLPSIKSTERRFNLNKPDDGDYWWKAATNAPRDVVITQSNLYKHSPTIVFIREKYKNYLDWLAERSNYYYSQFGDTGHQLAWYDFERSLAQQQHKHNSNNMSNKKMSNGDFNEDEDTVLNDDEETVRDFEDRCSHEKMKTWTKMDSNVAAHNQKILTAVLTSLRNSNKEPGEQKKFRLDLDSVRRSPNDEPQKKLVKKQTSLRKLDPIRTTAKKDPISVDELLTTTSTKSQQCKPLRPNMMANNCNNLSNRVQFQTQDCQSTTTTNRSSTPSSRPTPPIILKPILKQAQSNAKSKTNKTSSKPSGGGGSGGDYLKLIYLDDKSKKQQRKPSVASSSSADEQHSTSSSSYLDSDNNNLNSRGAHANNKSSTLLLPPILPTLGLVGGRCSDDFYAVLSDMEKAKLV